MCAASTIREDGFNVSALSLGSHTGTHCDAPYHFLEKGSRIDELPLERFVGPGLVVDVREHAPNTPILWDELAPLVADIAEVSIVFLHTGWSAHVGSPAYFDHPFLDGRACERLLELGVRTIGIDAINIDPTPEGAVDRDQFPCHRLISEADGVIVENLANLGGITARRPMLSVLPLRLTGLDGAPTRAVALEDG